MYSLLDANSNNLITWVGAHAGFAGNEKADELAKSGTASLSPLDIPIDYSTLRNLDNQWYKDTILSRGQETALALMATRVRPVWRLRGFEAKIYLLWLLGGPATPKYLKDCHVRENPDCPRYKGGPIGTMVHYIGECCATEEARSVFIDFLIWYSDHGRYGEELIHPFPDYVVENLQILMGHQVRSGIKFYSKVVKTVWSLK